jgi:hypothetical protein
LRRAGRRPGLNALTLTRAIAVSPDHLALLQRVKDGVFEHRTDYTNSVRPPSGDTATSVELFGTLYKSGAKPGELTYAMNPRDLQDNLKSIKNGRQYSDFMIATIHAHQGDSILPPRRVGACDPLRRLRHLDDHVRTAPGNLVTADEQRSVTRERTRRAGHLYPNTGGNPITTIAAHTA